MICPKCGRRTAIPITVRDDDGRMIRVCRPCYYAIKEMS